jgi:hypothetical protein
MAKLVMAASDFMFLGRSDKEATTICGCLKHLLELIPATGNPVADLFTVENIEIK